MVPLIVKVLLGLGGGALLFGLGAKEAGAKTSASDKPPHLMPTWLEQQYNSARSNAATNPAQLSTVADTLEANGFATEAAELRGLAKTRAIADAPAAYVAPKDQIDAAALTKTAEILADTTPPTPPQPTTIVPSLPPAKPPAPPPVTYSPPPPTPAKAETMSGAKVELSPMQTLARRLSDHLNALVQARGSVKNAKGKEDTSLVRTFQTQAGLKVDGSYGPGTARMLGRYWGDVPIVFWWPRGTLPNTEVPKYRSDLETLALAAEDLPSELDQMRAKMLRLSAYRERGQGFGTTTVAPAGAIMTTQEADALRAQVAAGYFNRA